MEFALKTLVVFALAFIAVLVIIMIMNSMSGQSMNIADSAYNFLKNLIGVK